MNTNNWTEEQWKTYEAARVLVKVTTLESLILAAEAHSLGMVTSKTQKLRWQNMAKSATRLLDKVKARVERI